jgi:hypothetical protein
VRYKVKNVLIATTIAISSFVGFGGSANAASMHEMHRSPKHEHCVVRVVKHRVHGHMVVNKERVCR